MEDAALNTIPNDLDAGESAVCTMVNVHHVAATRVGHEVTAETQVIRLDGRRIFAIARDDKNEIGWGTHERRVVDLARLGRAKLALAPIVRAEGHSAPAFRM